MPQQFVTQPIGQDTFSDLLTNLAQNVNYRRQKQDAKAAAVQQYETAVRQGLVDPNGAELSVGDQSMEFGQTSEQQDAFNEANSGSFKNLTREGGIETSREVISHEDEMNRVYDKAIKDSELDPVAKQTNRMLMAGQQAMVEGAKEGSKYTTQVPITGPTAMMNNLAQTVLNTRQGAINQNAGVAPAVVAPNVPTGAAGLANKLAESVANARQAQVNTTTVPNVSARVGQDIRVSEHDAITASSKGRGIKVDATPTVISTVKQQKGFYTEDNEDIRSLRRAALFETMGNTAFGGQSKVAADALEARRKEIDAYNKTIQSDSANVDVKQGAVKVDITPEEVSGNVTRKDALAAKNITSLNVNNNNGNKDVAPKTYQVDDPNGQQVPISVNPMTGTLVHPIQAGLRISGSKGFADGGEIAAHFKREAQALKDPRYDVFTEGDPKKPKKIIVKTPYGEIKMNYTEGTTMRRDNASKNYGKDKAGGFEAGLQGWAVELPAGLPMSEAQRWAGVNFKE